MIQFSQLWGLVALVSLPVIVFLFALRPKRKTQVVSSNRLWEEAIRERQRGQGLQKLLRDLSLILFLLFALLLSLALAGLGWSLPSTESDDVVVILDVSASMQARGTGGLSRFEDARNQVAKVINSLDRNSRLLMMTSGRVATIRTAFESDRSSLGRTLEDIKVTDEAGDPRQAITLALSLLRNDSSGKIYFVTDRAFDSLDGLDLSRIEFKSVDGPSHNLAITRFDFRAEVGSAERYQVLVTVKNYTDNSQLPALRVELDEQPILVQPLELGPGQEKTLVIPLQGRIAGAATAVLAIEDDFARDNKAFAVVETREALSVLLVSSGNFYLDSVLAALPNVKVVHAEKLPEDYALQSQPYDVTILDGVQSTVALPAGNYLMINSLSPDLPVTDEGLLTKPAVTGVGSASLMKGIGLDGLRINRSRKISHIAEHPALQRLFWSDSSTLAFALIKDKKRIAWLGFDLADSNFPLHAAFPLFLVESLAWLHPLASQGSQTQVAAGEPVNVVAPATVTTVSVRTPSGLTSEHDLLEGKFQFRDTLESGIYRYRVGQNEYPFAVNLTNVAESDIRPRAVLPVAPRATPEVQSSGQTDIPLWPWLVMVALILLMLEWGLWCWRGASA